MTLDQAAAAWRREIRRVAPSAPAALQQWLGEQLAGADSAALARLADDLARVAELVSEEAASRVDVAAVIPLRRAAPRSQRPDDWPPAAA